MRSAGWVLALGVCLGAGAHVAVGQSTGQSSGQPAQQQKPEDNPFPGEPAKTPAAQEPAKKPDAAKPAGGDNDNPFPGESSDAPIIPVGPEPGAGPNGEAGKPADRAASDPDGDPVRSPDGTTPADDGFSSSRSGLTHAPADNDTEAGPGKPGKKKKTLAQVVQENLDIGKFYLDRKNWRAAQGRFQDAFALDKENAEAVWGLAEAERHLNLYSQAREHYELFLSYDPDGPHGKAARKALDEVQSAASAGNVHHLEGTGVQQK